MDFVARRQTGPVEKEAMRRTSRLLKGLAITTVSCCLAFAAPTSAAPNYQGLWWHAPAGSESSWGINFAHQGDVIFATWFTYDGYGAPMWLSATATRTGPGVYSGELIRTTGPAFNAIPFDPTKVARTVVGAATFTFAGGNAATFAYTVNGVPRTKAITRELFVPPAGTVCSNDVRTPATVTLTSPTLSPSVGDVMQLMAVARDASGALIPGTMATWWTSDSRGATMDAMGTFRALTTGNITVTARINGVSGTQPLTITPVMQVGVTVGAREVVFRYATDRCDDQDTPDNPARAVRAEDGSIVFFAGNDPRIYVSRGADFGSLKRDCSRPVLESADGRTPESYENREWLWTVYREGSRWHAFISNEFHDTVAATCRPGDSGAGNPCWYNSVTHAVSTDGARSFLKPSALAHVVAPPPYVWEPPLPGEQPSVFYTQGKFFEGYGAQASIIRARDGYYYSSLWVLPTKSDPGNQGVCAIRTDQLDDPASWRAWDGSGFNLRLTSPYVTGRPGLLCTYMWRPLGNLFNTYLDRYMQVFTSVEVLGGKNVCGVFYQLSADLFAWSPPQLLVETMDATCQSDTQKPGLLETAPLMYVALIDHADPTVNFEKPGRTPYLYYVRFNRSPNDPLYWYDRDLVRVPLTFTRLD